MKSLLVNPDLGYLSATPWGILAIGSYIKHIKGYEIELLDGNVEGEEGLFHKIRQKLPTLDLLGISAFSSNAPFVVNLCKMVKEENRNCKIILGGPHAILCPEETIHHPNIDFVAYSDGEETFAGLMEEMESGRHEWERVPGLLYLDNGSVVRTVPPTPVEHYPTDYTLLDERVQATFKGSMDILAGRGCPFKCTFCFNTISGQKWRGKPIEMLGEEIKSAVATYDPNRIYFRDELFFHDKKRIKELIDFYKSNNFRFKWRASIRATDFRKNILSDEILFELAEAGCETLKFGFETASDRMLKKIKKGIQLKDIINTSERFANLNRDKDRIQLNCSWIVGFPGETYEEMCATISLAGQIQMDVPNTHIIGPQNFRIYPGGELYNTVIEEYDYRVPQSLEGWAERYLKPENMNGFIDKGVHYPWLSPKAHFICSNADFFVEFAYNKRFRYIDGYKKRLFEILRPLVLFRLRHNFFAFPIDLKLACAILDFSIWTFLENSPLYSRLQENRLYKSFKQTRVFRRLVNPFIG
ncbi:MAG: B12-binding domain-containing radical SAM protein [Magnetococcales bacterium]|nr:B12-binding domain-containing radical SAM protein [Magnetococcales bacterium]